MHHSQVRTLRPVICIQGCSSGQTAPSAELASDWWRDAKALTKPGMFDRSRQTERDEAGKSTLQAPKALEGNVCVTGFLNES